LWLVFWIFFYDKSEEQKRLTAAELNYINSDKDEIAVSKEVVEESVPDSAAAVEPGAAVGKVSWFKLLDLANMEFYIWKIYERWSWWFFLFSSLHT
jgi:ACS family hexuronate transporter-like MFS transporter